MIVHGAVILLIGLVAGLPYGQSIRTGVSEPRQRAWSAAHTGLTGTGVMLIALGAVARGWGMDGQLGHATTLSLIASGYGFVFAMVLAACTGKRGLTAAMPIANLAVAAGYVFSVTTVLIGAGGFLVLAWENT
ncbi:hypothetical protein [Mycolicibacterium farcinogenes]|uniref:Uncharacterized protein n=1 Tax=Mycolicibacterium farcinogenes TaxID=1802 RepID=A0ACD1FQW8_MYCFR|nr:hypothetical protein [Mycolicibacterium farcinogenes]QZH69449.1 hypothetical protein K6L26_30415 [Mycolicibacterium farcinogenes]